MIRQDPDVIFVGEIRDPESAMSAIQAAETGHLVISTLHTIDCMETINRVLDLFPPQHQREVRSSFAGSLRGIVSQRLVTRADGKGRVPAVEVLVNTGRVFDRIVDPDTTDQIVDVIAEGDFYGMDVRLGRSCNSPRKARHQRTRPPSGHEPARLRLQMGGKCADHPQPAPTAVLPFWPATAIRGAAAGLPQPRTSDLHGVASRTRYPIASRQTGMNSGPQGDLSDVPPLMSEQAPGNRHRDSNHEPDGHGGRCMRA